MKNSKKDAFSLTQAEVEKIESSEKFATECESAGFILIEDDYGLTQEQVAEKRVFEEKAKHLKTSRRLSKE